jgi:hypothetical protein
MGFVLVVVLVLATRGAGVLEYCDKPGRDELLLVRFVDRASRTTDQYGTGRAGARPYRPIYRLGRPP